MGEFVAHGADSFRMGFAGVGFFVVTLNPLSDNVARIIRTKNENDFFILENRQQKGWDEYIPGHGMLVWHINFVADLWEANQVNSGLQHIDLIEADAIRDLLRAVMWRIRCGSGSRRRSCSHLRRGCTRRVCRLRHLRPVPSVRCAGVSKLPEGWKSNCTMGLSMAGYFGQAAPSMSMPSNLSYIPCITSDRALSLLPAMARTL